MKKAYFIGSILALLLFGANCSNTNSNDNSIAGQNVNKSVNINAEVVDINAAEVKGAEAIPTQTQPVVTQPAIQETAPVVVPEPDPEPTTPVVVPARIQESESAPTQQTCCKICSKGKACGNSCISRSYTCHQPPGCACDG